MTRAKYYKPNQPTASADATSLTKAHFEDEELSIKASIRRRGGDRPRLWKTPVLDSEGIHNSSPSRLFLLTLVSLDWHGFFTGVLTGTVSLPGFVVVDFRYDTVMTVTSVKTESLIPSVGPVMHYVCESLKPSWQRKDDTELTYGPTSPPPEPEPELEPEPEPEP
jgi:hypothetical protein